MVTVSTTKNALYEMFLGTFTRDIKNAQVGADAGFAGAKEGGPRRARSSEGVWGRAPSGSAPDGGHEVESILSIFIHKWAKR